MKKKRKKLVFKSEIIAQMPKVELHCHLDGSLSLSVIKELAKNAGIHMTMSDEEILEKAQAPENTKNLLEYLQRFDFVLPLLQTYKNLELAAYDVVRQAANDNIKYIEIRFAPSQHLLENLTLEEAVEAVIAGLSRAENDFDIRANALVCGLKQEPIQKLQKLLPLFDKIPDEHFVGFDMAGDELNYPQEKFVDLIHDIKIKGVNVTLHAGECPACEKNILDSIAMGASRIGHGIMTKNLSEAEQKMMIEKQIVLEMAPTSNFQTKAVTELAQYPFKELYDKGIHVTLNTDNRMVSATNLSKEYEKISAWYPDFSLSDFEKINHYAIDGAFIGQEEKEELHQRFTKEYQKISE